MKPGRVRSVAAVEAAAAAVVMAPAAAAVVAMAVVAGEVTAAAAAAAEDMVEEVATAVESEADGIEPIEGYAARVIEPRVLVFADTKQAAPPSVLTICRCVMLEQTRAPEAGSQRRFISTRPPSAHPACRKQLRHHDCYRSRRS